MPASYYHKQSGKLYLHLIMLTAVLVATAILLAVLWRQDQNRGGVVAGIIASGAATCFAECFQSLLVQDGGDYLVLRFGPIPLLHKQFPYSEMTAVEPSRSKVIDSWGIHWVPGRGWTYNLWGFDCVKVTMGKKTVRIGTDDVAGLVEFLRGKIKETHP